MDRWCGCGSCRRCGCRGLSCLLGRWGRREIGEWLWWVRTCCVVVVVVVERELDAERSCDVREVVEELWCGLFCFAYNVSGGGCAVVLMMNSPR
jgi:hypothetical protein